MTSDFLSENKMACNGGDENSHSFGDSGRLTLVVGGISIHKSYVGVPCFLMGFIPVSSISYSTRLRLVGIRKALNWYKAHEKMRLIEITYNTKMYVMLPVFQSDLCSHEFVSKHWNLLIP